MGEQINIKDFKDYQSFELKDNGSQMDKKYCDLIGRKCTQQWLHIVAKQVNETGCPETCCTLCDNLTCRQRCLGAGKRVRSLPQKYIDQGWNEIKTGDKPFPRLRGEYYEVDVLYKYKLSADQERFVPLRAAYNNYSFVLLDRTSHLPKGELVGWKYAKEKTNE